MIELHETEITFGSDILYLLHSIEPNNGFLNNEYNLSPNDCKQFLELLIKHSKGEELPQGWVPYTTYWLFDNNKPVGISRLRHFLNDYLREWGGHIGYAIGKNERQKGYGSEILRLTTEKAKEKGIESLLLTCSIDNIGSQKIIEKNNGKLIELKNEIHYYIISQNDNG